MAGGGDSVTDLNVVVVAFEVITTYLYICTCIYTEDSTMNAVLM